MGKKYTNDILLKGIYTRTRKQCSLMQLNSYAISKTYDNPSKKNLTTTYIEFPILLLLIRNVMLQYEMAK